MIDVVTFKWRCDSHVQRFTSKHVNALSRMVKKHYAGPLRFTAITDDPAGIESDIRVIPLWPDHANVASPFGLRHPACYRRLKLFAPEARELIGERIVCLDLDVVVTGALAPLWDRPEDMIFYKGQWGGIGTRHSRNPYNGSMFMLTAGARPQVWQKFEPEFSPWTTRGAGYGGSDQAWFAYILGKGEAVWSSADGVYSYRNEIKPDRNRLPADARMVIFHGRHNPWDGDLQRIAWIRQHYATTEAAC